MNTWPVHYASYWLLREAREFEKENVDRELSIDAILPSKVYCALSIDSVERKDAFLGFFVNSRDLNAEMILNSCLVLGMAECIDSFDDKTKFQTLATNSKSCKVDIAYNVAINLPSILTMAISIYAQAIGIKECAKDASKSKGYPTLEFQVAFCRCELRINHHILANAIHAYRPHSKGSSDIFWCNRKARPDEVRVLYKLHQPAPPC